MSSEKRIAFKNVIRSADVAAAMPVDDNLRELDRNTMLVRDARTKALNAWLGWAPDRLPAMHSPARYSPT